MGKMIYNRETGEARNYEHVDAREILESAPELYTDREPKVEDPAEGLTDREINADLEGAGVEFDPRDSKAERLAQRKAARAEKAQVQ